MALSSCHTPAYKAPSCLSILKVNNHHRSYKKLSNFFIRTFLANKSNFPIRKSSQQEQTTQIRSSRNPRIIIIMAEVKVFGAWGSSFSRRVEMALKLKGVVYDYIEEDLTNKSPLLLQYNPVHKKVPVLLHNGKPIAESLVILEYIDETWENGPSILPKNPYDRAIARFWAKFIDEKCLPAMWTACWSAGEEQVKAKEEAEELLKFLDNELKGKKFFGGDSIGLVDIAANFIAYWSMIFAELVGIKLITNDKFPNLCAWMDEYLNSSFVKEHLPDREKLAEYFGARFLKTSAAAK